MRCQLSRSAACRLSTIAILVIALLPGIQALAAEPQCAEPARDCFIKRLGPAGGWNLYGGGLLHWWDPCCFPRCGGVDDYCRKPLPRVCWPVYPPYYIWGPQEPCNSPSSDCRNGKDRELLK